MKFVDFDAQKWIAQRNGNGNIGVHLFVATFFYIHWKFNVLLEYVCQFSLFCTQWSSFGIVAMVVIIGGMLRIYLCSLSNRDHKCHLHSILRRIFSKWMNFFLCINGDAWMRFSSFWATNDHATKKEVQKAIAFPYEKTRVRTSTGTKLLFANIKNWIDSKVAQNQSQGNDKERKRERKKEMPIKVKPCWIESLTFESYIQWHSWEYSVHTIISPFFTIDTVFSYLFSLKAEKTIFLL